MYFKQADASGKPSIRVYDLVERAQGASGASSATDIKLPDYATKEELAAAVDALKGDLAKIRKAMKRRDEDDEE